MTLEVVQNTLYKMERYALILALETRNNEKYNYPKRNSEEIMRYLPVLEKAEEVLLFNKEGCLESGCFENLDKIIGIVNSTIVYNERKRQDIIISNNDKWALKNVDCVTYNRWEKLSQIICDSMGVNIEITEKKCDLTYNLSKDIITCDVFAAITTYNKACNLGLELKKDEQKCNVEYKILADKYPDCDLTAKLYKDLVKCGMTYDIVETIVCKGGLSVTVKDDEAYLHTPLGELNMNSDLQVKSIVSPENCAKTLCKTRGTSNLTDTEFMELLACDYNLSKENKIELFKTFRK